MPGSFPPLPPDPLAHLDAPAGAPARAHRLIDHLRDVGELAAAFGEPLGAIEWARLAGRWHDLGKYAGDFQKRIREENGFEAHIEADPNAERDHSTAGAIHASKALPGQGAPLAFVIAGHHAGLANFEELADRCRRKHGRYEQALREGPPAEILDVTARPAPPAHLGQGRREEQELRHELWIRMLFSALCDADFLDTEAFYDQRRAALRGGGPAIDELAARLAAFLDGVQSGAPATEVNRVRAEVRAACIEAAAGPPGVYSLTVPTGGGKTLASLAFGLAHAARHGGRRVVVAIPFTSILEQSARAYRDALGEEAVIEHHSAMDPSRETARNRVACENWDAPVIVTTTVQLFESLFANRPSACRKLHRLARSVIVLDEAQTLPPGLLAPLLDVLRTLVEQYGVTLVLSTATQPALRKREGLPEGFPDIHEIVPASIRAFDRLHRVRPIWPATAGPTEYPALAVEVAREQDVLVVVHRRDDARALCHELDALLGHERTVHLSALMCPEHRSVVLSAIKEAKRRGEAVRVVSTQLVEAGVDLDFAVVYRALGGVDSLAQAAGRCNREGKLEGLGELRIFEAPTAPPPGVPRRALAITRGLLEKDPALNLFACATYEEYFRQLYTSGPRDRYEIQRHRRELHYQDVATLFRMIEDDWSAPLVVPYGRAEALVRELERFGPTRARMRALQRFTITVPRKLRAAWVEEGIVREVAETVAFLRPEHAAAYTERFGLVPERAGALSAAGLIVEG